MKTPDSLVHKAEHLLTDADRRALAGIEKTLAKAVKVRAEKKRLAVLAFSGGLDTSFCVPWLRERGWDVVTVLVDTGGFSREKVREIGRRAKELGAKKHFFVDGRREIFDRLISHCIRANGTYQQMYPVMCADRYLIVEKSWEFARRLGAEAVAHGCTGMGNDQVRFDVTLRALGCDNIQAPIRDFQAMGGGPVRERERKFLEERGFPVATKHTRYSINQNVFGVTISGSEIDERREPAEDAWTLTAALEKTPAKADRVTVGFEGGLPVSIGGKKFHGTEILRRLNEVAGKHGVGRFLYTGDCVIGIKGRIAFECPGLHTVLVAHRALEEAVLSKEQNQFKDTVGRKWTELAYNGLFYDPLARNLEVMLGEMQRHVTGAVTVKLHRGTALPVAYESSHELRQRGTLYAQTSSWSPDEATAFVKLFGMSTVMAARRPSPRKG
ncbi:MAG: argininosuccinate synthase [Planctomycetes bacterium]|nr:argininosuccinate synthase [Planctomycetota bacterium]